MQQLGEHGIAGMLAGVFGLKPNFAGLNVDQALGKALQPQCFDVNIFDIFFTLCFLQRLIQAHH